MKTSRRYPIPWQLATIIAIGVSVCALLIASYVYNARQQLGADYTALVGDIVRAQQAIPQMQIALEGFTDQPKAIHLRQINHVVWLSQQYLNHVQNGLSQHPQLMRGAEYLQEDIATLPNQLDMLSATAQAAVHNPSLITQLQHHARDLEADMAWVYFELNDVVHSAAGQQRLIMQRLSAAVSVLVAMVIVIAIILLIAVLRLQHKRDTLKTLMLTDELTGLPNRRYFVNTAEAQIANAKHQQQPLSLLLIDLDYFKHVNDSFGHPVGDDMLRRVGTCMAQLKRHGDTLARIGGEEFCLLMPDTAQQDAANVAERIRKGVVQLTFAGVSAHHQQTVSIGVSCTHNGMLTFEQLYSLADKALYQAKANGRNQVSVLHPTQAPPHGTKGIAGSEPSSHHSL